MHRFLRFQTELRSPRTGRRLGLFHALGELEKTIHLPTYREELVAESLRWFNRNLTAPRLSPRQRRGIFWFRDDASDCLAQIWMLVAILNDEGICVQLHTTTRPGQIVYRDDHQIAAIPGKR